MKILICSNIVPSKELGASKVLMEVAEELQELGWSYKLLSPTDLFPETGMHLDANYSHLYPERLRNYLHVHATEYDVVDYHHIYLPYSRSEFSQKTLFVARSVLLIHHYEVIQIPTPNTLRGKIGHLIKGSSRKAQLQALVRNATTTIQEADLVNVSNDDDKQELVRRGIPAEKIAIIPFGINRSRRPLFDVVSSATPHQPTVAFVGTFDPRKGSNDFPKIVKYISAALPNVKFRLLGASYKTNQEILRHFDRKLSENIEVIPSFRPEELPELLASCSVGIFPSYLEGFGFGVLEMLAASIPVIAYQAPGPPMMLPPDYLVPRGDTKSMSEKAIALLRDKEKLSAARLWAKQQSQKFCWQRIAQTTSETYLNFLELKRSANRTTPDD
jgi:glycosyltransferase involved in cell wall biosynthesis